MRSGDGIGDTLQRRKSGDSSEEARSTLRCYGCWLWHVHPQENRTETGDQRGGLMGQGEGGAMMAWAAGIDGGLCQPVRGSSCSGEIRLEEAPAPTSCLFI